MCMLSSLIYILLFDTHFLGLYKLDNTLITQYFL